MYRDCLFFVLMLSDPYKHRSQPFEKDKKTYLRYMENVAVYFGSRRVDARIDQQEVLEFSMKLAKISEDGKKYNMSDLNNPYVLSELQFEFKNIKWYEYLSGILSPSVELKYDEQIFVPDPFYLMELERYVLLNTSKRVLANFMAWHTSQHYIHFLPSELVNKYNEYMEIHEDTSREPRWQMCINAVKQRMGPVVSSAFIEQYFDEETRREVTEMMHGIKARYKKTLQDFEWIDEPAKRMTQEKLLYSAADIVSYGDLNSLSQLASSFNDVKIYHDNLLLSVVNLEQFALDRMFQKLRKTTVGTNWLEDPDFVTGLHIAFSSSRDILVFPIGILGGPYYANHRPRYSNYGSLGSIIAQKMWQVLTSTEYEGRKGEAKAWWSSSSLLNYEHMLKCLGRVFESNAVSGNNMINASKASEEDLAYLIGAKVSYDTYEKWSSKNGKEPQIPGMNFSPKQLFWIYFSGPFCSKYVNQFESIEHMKVNGIVSNLQEFSDDFGCESDDRMNLEHKCRIF